MDVARFNFSWGDAATKIHQIALLRELAQTYDRPIPCIVDLPGPRVQKKQGHGYDATVAQVITAKDREFIQFAIEQNCEYVAVSFVAGPADIVLCRKIIEGYGGNQKVIAKIERAVALEALDAIIEAADAIMVARGDLGNEVALEQIPFIQAQIVTKAKAAGKPVIVATQMMLSMVDNPTPTRAEVSDVANAILQGADAVMLSEETAKGSYPVESVAVMEKIVFEAEKHLSGQNIFNTL